MRMKSFLKIHCQNLQGVYCQELKQMFRNILSPHLEFLPFKQFQPGLHLLEHRGDVLLW